MTPDTPQPDAAESITDGEMGGPLLELQDLSLDVGDRLRRRVRGSINRRVLAGELVGLAWTAPLTILLEFFSRRKRTVQRQTADLTIRHGLPMQQQLSQILRGLQQIIVEAIPRVIVGVVVAVALVLVAKLVERLLRATLVRIRFESLLEQAGVDKVLQRIGIRESLSQVLPRLAYFLLLLLFARTAADSFGLVAISEGIAAMFAYLPNVAAAVLLVVVGTSVSQFAGRTVTLAAEESGIEFARSLGSLVSGLILFIVGIMAIGQLRFDTDMVRIVTACMLSGLALAFGLSVGLGTRDITRNVMAGFYARKVFSSGDTLEIRGQRGVLKAIMATQTLIEQEGGLVSVANAAFLDETIRCHQDEPA